MNTVVPQTSTTAVLSLVFGLLTWCALPFVGAIIAVVTGHIARGEIRRAPAGAIEGDGLALVGLILGYLQLAFCVLAIGFFVLVMIGLFGGALLSSASV